MRGEDEQAALYEEEGEEAEAEGNDDSDDDGGKPNPKDWFALFCTAEVSLAIINEILKKAAWNGVADDPEIPEWRFWLATKDWEFAKPHKKYDDGTDRMATEAPVESFTSPFIGQDLKSLAKALVDAPRTASLNREYFAVLDERSVEDKSVVLCCILEDSESVDWLRIIPETSSFNLVGISMAAVDWNEVKGHWNELKRRFGRDVLDWQGE